MCGRVVLVDPVEVLAQLLDVTELPESMPLRYNLAPTDPIPVVRTPQRLELLRWGLTLDNPKAGGFNARVESLGLYRHTQRCLVVVSGFYEWRRLDAKTKQPHLIRRMDGMPMVFAGFSDGTDGCAIVTAPAKGLVAELHDRMPVVLERDTFSTWLDPANDVRPMVAAASADGLKMFPVSQRVGDVRNDDPRLVEEVAELEAPAPRQLGLF